MFKMSKRYAGITEGLRLVVINNQKIGYRCTLEASKNLIKSSGGNDVASVNIDGEVIWVSRKEFKENKLIEVGIYPKYFKGGQSV